MIDVKPKPSPSAWRALWNVVTAVALILSLGWLMSTLLRCGGQPPALSPACIDLCSAAEQLAPSAPELRPLVSVCNTPEGRAAINAILAELAERAGQAGE